MKAFTRLRLRARLPHSVGCRCDYTRIVLSPRSSIDLRRAIRVSVRTLVARFAENARTWITRLPGASSTFIQAFTFTVCATFPRVLRTHTATRVATQSVTQDRFVHIFVAHRTPVHRLPALPLTTQCWNASVNASIDVRYDESLPHVA